MLQYTEEEKVMKIAVEGCAHGELDKIYDTLAYIESQEGIKVDLLLICGDFQVCIMLFLCTYAVPLMIDVIKCHCLKFTLHAMLYNLAYKWV